jgi:hypothetical protein
LTAAWPERSALQGDRPGIPGPCGPALSTTSVWHVTTTTVGSDAGRRQLALSIRFSFDFRWASMAFRRPSPLGTAPMRRIAPTRSSSPSRSRLRTTSRRLRGPLARNARRRVARKARRRRFWLAHSLPEGRDRWKRCRDSEPFEEQPQLGLNWQKRSRPES